MAARLRTIADLLLLAHRAVRIDEDYFEVPSESRPGATYRVNALTGFCPCIAFQYRQSCKHSKAVSLACLLLKQWSNYDK